MTDMNGFGAQAYRNVGVDSGVASAHPHQLVLMLYDGALEAVRLARTHLAAGRVAEKGQALGKAARIVEEGLKASLDRRSGGPLAGQLAQLYDYLSMRLLQANLRNDRAALDEVERLLGELRGAWARIDPQGRPAVDAAAEAVPAGRIAVTA
jgi:flagellar protein FliS